MKTDTQRVESSTQAKTHKMLKSESTERCTRQAGEPMIAVARNMKASHATRSPKGQVNHTAGYANDCKRVIYTDTRPDRTSHEWGDTRSEEAST